MFEIASLRMYHQILYVDHKSLIKNGFHLQDQSNFLVNQPTHSFLKLSNTDSSFFSKDEHTAICSCELRSTDPVVNMITRENPLPNHTIEALSAEIAGTSGLTSNR